VPGPHNRSRTKDMVENCLYLARNKAYLINMPSSSIGIVKQVVLEKIVDTNGVYFLSN
jgi:hypothetical protein